jgi:hypothetical protein
LPGIWLFSADTVYLRYLAVSGKENYSLFRFNRSIHDTSGFAPLIAVSLFQDSYF